MELKFQVQARIQKPVEEVFDGVYNPTKITQYFATESASGPLSEGSRVIWRFADYTEDVPLSVKEVIVNQLIAFEWEAGMATTPALRYILSLSARMEPW